MHPDLIWQHIIDLLAHGDDVCLVTMVHAEGEGPNQPGCKMTVTRAGLRTGTVGGGASEYALAEAAQQALTTPSAPTAALKTLTHQPDAGTDASGMICAGTQTFALLRITTADQNTLACMTEALQTSSPGGLTISARGLSFAPGTTWRSCNFDPDQWAYRETIGLTDTATLIGGGHVSLALSPLLTSIGMEVVILDNRPDLDTMERNLLAREKRVIDFANASQEVRIGPHSYVCIMTFGHRDDETVLAQLIDLDLRYLGMMGSKAKTSQIFANLENRGISRQKLASVHAPIGIPINSNTPEEIAISIAAQIVAVRQGATAQAPQ